MNNISFFTGQCVGEAGIMRGWCSMNNISFFTGQCVGEAGIMRGWCSMNNISFFTGQCVSNCEVLFVQTGVTWARMHHKVVRHYFQSCQ